MAKVLIVGEIYRESQYFVGAIPAANEVSIADSLTNIFGSKTLNVARVLSRLGNDVTFFARIGMESRVALETAFADYAISTERVSPVKTITGEITVITETSGSSAMALFRGANDKVTIEDIEILDKDLAEFDLVYVTTHLAAPLLSALVALCRDKTKVFIDFPNRQAEINLKHITTADFIAPNRQETELMLDTKIDSIKSAFEALQKIRKHFSGNILITLDADGCVLLQKDSGQPEHFATEAVTASDSAAAGDIFRAAFVSELLKSKKIAVAISKALRLATASVKIKGVNDTINNLDYSI